MACNFLDFKVLNKLAVITINRINKKNAINKEMYVSLANLLNEVSEREDVTVTVLTGAGNYYSSGNDLAAAAPSKSGDVDMPKLISESTDRVRNLVEAFINHSKVLVAIVNGPAIGIAATTLALCDVVYAVPDAWFQTPFSQLGLCSEAASSYTFPKILGYSKAGDMLYFNKKMTAAEALEAGLVARVVPRERLDSEIWASLKENAANLSPKSLAATKQLIRRFDINALHEANRSELVELRRLFMSEEALQALMKFMSRRSKM